MTTARRHARTALLGVAVVLTVLHCWRFRDFTVDDAAISYAYSQNFAHGDGLVATAHGERVEGYSNFLWVLLVGVVVAAFGHVLVVAKVLGLLLAVVITVGSAELAAALRNRRSALDAVPALLCAAFTPLPYWSMSGLENPLFLALTVCGCVRLLVEARDPSRRPWSALCFAALALTRPDGLVVAAAAAAAQLLTRHQRRRLPVWIVAAALPIAAHLLWRYAYYAYPWPNTYYVKVAFPFQLRELADFHANGWLYVIAFYRRYHLLAPAVLAALALVNRDVRPRLVLVGVLTATIFFPIYARGDWMSEGRFAVAAIPLLLVLATDGIANVARRATWVVGAVVTLLLVWSIVPNSIRLSNARVHHYPVPVEGVAERARHYRELATALAVERPSVADGDAGGNLLYAGMPLVDIGWLNDATLAHWGRDPRFVREYIFGERRPTFLRLTGYWLQTHLQDHPEFREYVAAPADGDGLYIARSAFTVEGVDTRHPVAHLTDAVDLVGYVTAPTTVTAWLLARADAPRGRLLVRTPGQALAAVPGRSIYAPALWRAGEIIEWVAPRPAGAAPHLCLDEACVELGDGSAGAAPIALPQASDEDVARLVARGEWRAAFFARRARGQPTEEIGKAAYARALALRAAGETSAAFDAFDLALCAAPALAFARRHLEELRPEPRRGYHPLLTLRLAAAVRQFQRAPDAAAMTTVVELALAARDPFPAVRAHLATGIAPTSVARLAECYLDAGLPQPAAALLADRRPATEEEHATFDRIALASGRRDLFDRWNDAPPSPPLVAPGLQLTSASATLSSSGDTILRLVLRRSGAAPPATLDVDGTPRPLDFAASVDGERRVQTFALGHPAAAAPIAVGAARVVVASLVSPTLNRDVAEVCALVGGSPDSRVVLRRGGEAIAEARGTGEIGAPACLRKTEPSDGDWTLAVEDTSAGTHLVLDDPTCFARSGVVVPCAGSVTASVAR